MPGHFLLLFPPVKKGRAARAGHYAALKASSRTISRSTET